MGRNIEAMKIHRQALNICLNNYGDKHTFVSLAYKHIADDFLSQNNCDSALYYYQRSLIAVVNNFNNTDIFTNPSIDSAIFDIRLLENLKAKAEAFEVMADQQKNDESRLKVMKGSVETINLALQLIDRIRNNYPTEESRIYLAENEKETYFFAMHLVHSLYKLTKDGAYIDLMYRIAQKAKASVLRNEINQNELFYSSVIPDSLLKKRNSLSSNISAYNNLIHNELKNKEPNNKMITLWKDDIFEMNRDLERNEEYIDEKYPEYHELIDRTEPVNPATIQQNLENNENVIDYFLSNNYNKGRRSLYMFLIAKDRLDFREEELDSLFSVNTNVIRKWPEMQQQGTATKEEFKSYTESLFEMYTHLVNPFKEEFSGKRLIIIPDEEIAWLPFDAFLTEKPASGLSDYEGLKYLLYDYSISYRYISSLIVRKSYKLSGNDKIYAFAPDYNGNGASSDHTERLRGAENEIESIMKRLNGKKFTGSRATVSDFREIMQSQAVLHLAMHSLSDSANSRFSYLMFEPDSINPEGRLYNYEISLSRIKSPMVVLSACNSGTGTLYHGEGLMSLARGFILAGASSVIRTAWDVNDETSAEIISDFYLYLSKGKTKDEALQMAKMDYIKSNPPVYTNPYYWAAYEVMGDNSPIIHNRWKYILFILVIVIAVGAIIWLSVYLRRRNNFSARSL